MTLERLLAYAILTHAGFPTGGQYRAALDQLIRERPGDPLAAELEISSGDLTHSIHLLEQYFQEKGGFSLWEFGSFLLQEMEGFYDHRKDLRSFSRMVCRAWKLLPVILQQLQPFRLLYYGSEASLGDENSCEEYYLQAFHFFRD